MAATQTISAPGASAPSAGMNAGKPVQGAPAAPPAAAKKAEVSPGPALVRAAPGSEEKAANFNPVIARLPVELDVMVPVRDFRVRNLLALETGQVIESQWGNGDDVPLAAGAVELAWSEFEVIDNQLTVRITRLA